MFKQSFTAMAVSMVALLALSACNTTEGIGRDLESVGNEIAEEAEDNS